MAGQDGFSLSPKALKEAERIQAESYPGQSLRLYIDGKGCDGFFYGVTFDQSSENDLHFPQGSLDCIIDPEAYIFCKGSSIDWIDDERGRGFLVDNPNQRHFRGKFYKKAAWQKKLTQSAEDRTN